MPAGRFRRFLIERQRRCGRVQLIRDEGFRTGRLFRPTNPVDRIRDHLLGCAAVGLPSQGASHPETNSDQKAPGRPIRTLAVTGAVPNPAQDISHNGTKQKNTACN